MASTIKIIPARRGNLTIKPGDITKTKKVFLIIAKTLGSRWVWTDTAHIAAGASSYPVPNVISYDGATLMRAMGPFRNHREAMAHLDKKCLSKGW